MKEVRTMLKPWDYILVLLALTLSLLPLLITSHLYHPDNSTASYRAVVKIHGEIVDEFLLDPQGDRQEQTYYPAPGQYNIIEVHGDRIRVKEDNSPDQIAVRTGWISRPGQISVCLPHGLMIEVQGMTSDAQDPLILPHP